MMTGTSTGTVVTAETTVMSIDPGLHECGMALSVGGYVTRCQLIKSESLSKDPLVLGQWLADTIYDKWGLVDYVAVERPVYRARGKQNIRVDDLLALSVVAGCFACLGRVVISFTPKEWKGDLPKVVHHGRIEKWLGKNAHGTEIALWQSLTRKIDHNAKDAFALNLFSTGRTKRGGEV